jgi:hypothetical protein
MSGVPDIGDMQVYDPAKDGIDYKTFLVASQAIRDINEKLAYSLGDGLHSRVLRSSVAPGLTLEEYLFDAVGYFRMSEADGVVFLNGRLERTFSFNDMPDLEALAAQSNAIPFCYTRTPMREPVNFLFDAGLFSK